MRKKEIRKKEKLKNREFDGGLKGKLFQKFSLKNPFQNVS
jgi:hypothetical protein